MKEQKQVYFSGLNGLRFFAALAVIITHIELLKGSFGYKSYWKNPLFFNLGGLGVYFFFVLSGFLITYLLLTEKNRYEKINIGQFYLRRILRIWPLYYFILILGFFILPKFEMFHIAYLQESFNENFTSNLLLYIFILPNLAFSFFPAVPNIGQAWSIGVEEQFYLVWPWLVAKSKNIFNTLVILIVGLILLKFIVLILGKYYGSDDWYKALKLFVAMSKFECMATGGIGAILLFRKDKSLSLVYNKWVLNLSLLLIFLLIYITPNALQDGIHIFYSFLFLVVILNVANATTKLNFENKLFNYLGKISYGIYMYHFIIIPAVLYIARKYISIDNEIILNSVIYSIVILTTILVSGLSYQYFEQPFIKLKGKYSPVKSGDSN